METHRNFPRLLPCAGPRPVAESGLRVYRGTLGASLAVLVSTQVWANPTGGVVVGGQATISQRPGATVVDQATDRAVINWQGFSIDRTELTRFKQPTREAIALNRVLGNDPSQILGQLQANGHVWLINPNGIVFGPTARVDVHGLVATTADIANEDFIAGRYDFAIPSADSAASVVNQGQISIGEYGLAGLVAPHVSNAGLISGRLGQVVIAGAPTFTLDFYGDGLIQFEATSKVTESLDANRALVENDGTIRADGGSILITASAVTEVVDEVINVGGIVEARSFTVEDGTIVLDGGDAGLVRVAGVLDASGRGPAEQGGEVGVLGDQIALSDAARVDVSGDYGGGRVLIGGNAQGNGPEPNARQATVAKEVKIYADAITEGDGGEVVIWSEEGTRYQGAITARGGREGGDGGWVEVSGRDGLEFTGIVDLSAVSGNGGELLLDPNNITIAESATASITGDGSEADPFTTSADGAVLGVDVLQAALVSANVVVRTGNAGADSEDGDITVAAVVTAPANASSLTLEAHNDIQLDADIDMSESSGNLALRADAVAPNGSGRIDGPGTLIMGSGDLLLTAGSGIGQVGSELQTRNLGTLAARVDVGSIAIENRGAGDIVVGTVGGIEGLFGADISVRNEAGSITLNAAVDACSGCIADIFALGNDADLVVNAPIEAGERIDVRANNDVRLETPVTLTVFEGFIAVRADADADQRGRIVNPGSATLDTFDVFLGAATGIGTADAPILTAGPGEGSLTLGADTTTSGGVYVVGRDVLTIAGEGVSAASGDIDLRTAAEGSSVTVAAPVAAQDGSVLLQASLIIVDAPVTAQDNSVVLQAGDFSIGSTIGSAGELGRVEVLATTPLTVGAAVEAAGAVLDADELGLLSAREVLLSGTDITVLALELSASGTTAFTTPGDISIAGDVTIDGDIRIDVGGNFAILLEPDAVGASTLISLSGDVEISANDFAIERLPGSGETLGGIVASVGTISLVTDQSLSLVETPDTVVSGASLTADEVQGLAADTLVLQGAGLELLTAIDFTGSQTAILRSASDVPDTSLDVTQAEGGVITANVLGIEFEGSASGNLVLETSAGNNVQELVIGPAPGSGAAIGSVTFRNATSLSVATGDSDADLEAGDINLSVLNGDLSVDQAILSTGTVTLEAANDVVINAAIDMSASTDDLNLRADGIGSATIASDGGGDVQVDAPITMGTGFLSVNGVGVEVKAAISSDQSIFFDASGSFSNTAPISTTNGLLLISSGDLLAGASGDITIGGPVLASRVGEAFGNTVNLSAFGDLAVSADITAQRGDISLSSDLFANSAAITANQGSIRISAADFDIGASIAAATDAADGIELSAAGVPLVLASGPTEAGVAVLDPAPGTGELQFLSGPQLSLVAGAGIEFRDPADFSAFDTTLLQSATSSADGPADILQTADAEILANLLAIEVGRFTASTARVNTNLTNANNQVRILALSNAPDTDPATVGSLAFANGADLIVGSVNPDGITADRVTLNIDGRLTLDAPIVASGVGSSIVIDADGFVNNLGVDGLDPGGGRYLIYSLDPANDTRNVSADQFSKLYAFPFDPTDPEGANVGLDTVGNFFLYSIVPTLSIVADNVTREYGNANPGLTFTSNGLIDGDTLADALSETPVPTTTAGQTSDVGVFSIEVGPNTLVSPLNYTLNRVDGALEVRRAPLEITANDATRVVGEQNPVFSASLTGFKLDDDATVVTGLQFGTPAEFFSPPSQYPIVPFGAVADNYDVGFRDGTLFVGLGSPEDIPDGGTADRMDIPLDEKFDPPVPPPLTVPTTPVYELPVFTGRVSAEDLLFANDGNRELWGPSGGP